MDTEDMWEELKPKISDLYCPAVRLVKTKEAGNSKFGGKPFAESEYFSWPESNGQAMAFLAQLDLQEISKVVQFDWLPRSGVLLFFYDVFEMPWGFDPKDRGKWIVIFQHSANYEIEYPLDFSADAKISESYFSAKRVLVLPDSDSHEIEALNLTDEEMDVYLDSKDNNPHDMPLHQVGGFPSPVQGNQMDLESQLASNGLYLGDSKGYQSKEAKELEAGAKDWKLLFQFDSNDDLDIMWGDCGMLYFWVQEKKSKNKEFENTWLILQCC